MGQGEIQLSRTKLQSALKSWHPGGVVGIPSPLSIRPITIHFLDNLKNKLINPVLKHLRKKGAPPSKKLGLHSTSSHLLHRMAPFPGGLS